MKTISLSIFLKASLLIFLLSICNDSYCQPTIIGKWRRIEETSKAKKITNKILQFGDMEIRSDSTFHIEGDSKTKNSIVSGWHAGDEYNGTWEKGGTKVLILWVGDKNDKMFLSYIIVKLNKNDLILSKGFTRKDSYQLIFKRL